MQGGGMRAVFSFQPEAGLDQLLLRNAFLELVTLRLYRFWAITDQRCHLWSSLRIGDDVVEYTGHANELLRGFVIAFFILSPIYILICALREILHYDVLQLAILANVTFFGVIALFAIGQYQNRRYLLSCTVWRGIRAGQDGSSAIYAARYCFWALAFCMTAGLSVPWACEDLARFRIRHSFWGSYRGSFSGSARQILRSWLIVWSLYVGPCFAYLLWLIGNADWNVLVVLWESAAAYEDQILRGKSFLLCAWLGAAFGGLGAYVLFHPRWLLWYFGNTSVGPIHFSSKIDSNKAQPRCNVGIVILSMLFAALLALIIFADHHRLYQEFGYRKQTWLMLLAAAMFWPFCAFLFTRFISVPIWMEALSHILIQDISEADHARQVSHHPEKSGGGVFSVIQVRLV